MGNEAFQNASFENASFGNGNEDSSCLSAKKITKYIIDFLSLDMEVLLNSQISQCLKATAILVPVTK